MPKLLDSSFYCGWCQNLNVNFLSVSFMFVIVFYGFLPVFSIVEISVVFKFCYAICYSSIASISKYFLLNGVSLNNSVLFKFCYAIAL